MRRSTICRSSFTLAALTALIGSASSAGPFSGALVTTAQASSSNLSDLRKQGFDAIILEIGTAERKAVRSAAERVLKARLGLFYWIEVARCPELADLHPEWMASLQGHTQWRRHFPNFAQPAESEVVKSYPWVPITYRQAFDAHLTRIKDLLNGLPRAEGLYLNGLQAAPSACGCGNTLCRWTSDYGPISTAARIGPEAAVRFVSEVRKIGNVESVVPVWLPECRQHESKAGSECDGVPCFDGLCWVEWTKQLMPLAAISPSIGALLVHADSSQGESSIGSGIRSFQRMPPMRGGSSISASRLITILKGWNVSQSERKRAAQAARQAGVTTIVFALMPIDQSWQPRMHRFRAHRPQ